VCFGEEVSDDSLMKFRGNNCRALAGRLRCRNRLQFLRDKLRLDGSQAAMIMQAQLAGALERARFAAFDHFSTR
jgi:hypothetical protein